MLDKNGVVLRTGFLTNDAWSYVFSWLDFVSLTAAKKTSQHWNEVIRVNNKKQNEQLDQRLVRFEEEFGELLHSYRGKNWEIVSRCEKSFGNHLEGPIICKMVTIMTRKYIKVIENTDGRKIWFKRFKSTGNLLIEDKIEVLQHFINNDFDTVSVKKENEKEIIYTLQEYVHQNEIRTAKLLKELFRILATTEVICEEVFNEWIDEKNAVKKKGREIAIASYKEFRNEQEKGENCCGCSWVTVCTNNDHVVHFD